MQILEEIELRKLAHESCAHAIAPTIYAGLRQMVELRKMYDRVPHLKSTGEVGGIKFMGMPLVEVVAEDYLRIA